MLQTPRFLLLQNRRRFDTPQTLLYDARERRIVVGPIGFPEMLVIAVLALLIFGPRKLPELGRSVGKALAEFRRASADIRFTIEEEMREAERQAQNVTREVEHALETPPDSVPAGSVTPPEPAAEPSVEEKSPNGASKPA